MAVGGLTDLSDVILCPPPQKKLHWTCRMGRRIDADSLICSLRLCEFVSLANTTYKLSEDVTGALKHVGAIIILY